MKLTPHEIVWLIDHVDILSQKYAAVSPPVARWPDLDPLSGLPNRIVGCAVFLGESAGDTEVIARSATGTNLGQRDHGLTQISGRWNGDRLMRFARAGHNWRDPRVNIVIAKLIWDEFQKSKGNGWIAWHVYTTVVNTTTGEKSYQKHVPDAQMGALFTWPPPEFKPAQLVITVNQ